MGWNPVNETSIWDSSATKKRMRDEMVERLKIFGFGYALTVGWNHKSCSTDTMRRHLREYDARLNRWLNGTRWWDKPDERIIWVAFPEKVETNPHWHLLVALDREGFKDHRKARYSRFEMESQREWLALFPTGTAHCQPLAQGAYEWYITKELSLNDRYNHFILTREFNTK